MDIRAAEISAILKEQIANFGTEAEVAEVGQVLSVGDGIARIYGLDKVQAGEMVEFAGGIRGNAWQAVIKDVLMFLAIAALFIWHDEARRFERRIYRRASRAWQQQQEAPAPPASPTPADHDAPKTTDPKSQA